MERVFHILDVKNFSRKGIFKWRRRSEVLKKMKIFGSRTRWTATQPLNQPYPTDKKEKKLLRCIASKKKTGSYKNEVS